MIEDLPLPEAIEREIQKSEAAATKQRSEQVQDILKDLAAIADKLKDSEKNKASGKAKSE